MPVLFQGAGLLLSASQDTRGSFGHVGPHLVGIMVGMMVGIMVGMIGIIGGGVVGVILANT